MNVIAPTAELCLDRRDSTTPCSGPVLERLSVSGASTSIRCAGHDDEYRARMEPVLADLDRRYPRFAPDDFDPAYAGESWDGEDW